MTEKGEATQEEVEATYNYMAEVFRLISESRSRHKEKLA
jgi:hypothetical protein